MRYCCKIEPSISFPVPAKWCFSYPVSSSLTIRCNPNICPICLIIRSLILFRSMLNHMLSHMSNSISSGGQWRFVFQAHLEQEHQELQYKEQQLQLANSILERELETLTNTRDEKEKEATSLYIALEVTNYIYFYCLWFPECAMKFLHQNTLSIQNYTVHSPTIKLSLLEMFSAAFLLTKACSFDNLCKLTTQFFL